MGHKELRHDFVTNTGKRLAEHAHKAWDIPLYWSRCVRNETPFLRQVADGACDGPRYSALAARSWVTSGTWAWKRPASWAHSFPEAIC